MGIAETPTGLNSEQLLRERRCDSQQRQQKRRKLNCSNVQYRVHTYTCTFPETEAVAKDCPHILKPLKATANKMLALSKLARRAAAAQEPSRLAGLCVGGWIDWIVLVIMKCNVYDFNPEFWYNC
jgi:hypothetical protein